MANQNDVTDNDLVMKLMGKDAFLSSCYLFYVK